MLEMISLIDRPDAFKTQHKTRPLLFHQDGRIMMNFSRSAFLSLKGDSKRSGALNLSRIQIEALDAVEAIAAKHKVEIPMQRGDLIFINNFNVLHSRADFEDDIYNTRYLVRLWLKNEELAWDLPDVLKAANDKIFENSDSDEVWNILPVPRMTFEPRDRLTP